MQEYHPAPEVRVADATAPPGPPPISGNPHVPAGERHTGLGRFVAPLIVLAVGILGMVDLAGVDVAASAYLALPLAIVGTALVVRAWYGRGWSLAVFGAVLALALVVVTGAERVHVSTAHPSTWRPQSVEEVDASYVANVGDAVLDLSAVDFAGQSTDVRVSLDAGNLTVVVPSNVDVRVEAQVNVGNGVVFNESWGGIGQSRHILTNLGPDGPGGGELVLHATVNVGNLEVRR